jgi:hypothetical protein
LFVAGIAWIYHSLTTAELTNWDDDRFITYNPLFEAGGWTYVRSTFTQVQFEAYQPLHLLSYLPDRMLWPNWPPGFHLLNLALFVTDLALLWRLARRHSSDLAAFAAIAIVALHPLCVEPVAWVTDRKDLVMLGLFVLALGREDRRTGARPDLGALALYLCALVTKSSSVCFPIVLFAWLRWIRGRSVREACARSAGYAAAALTVSAIVVLVWRDHGMIAHSDAAAPALEVAGTIATYLAHVLWPVDLGPVYPNDAASSTAAVALCLVGAAAIAVGWRWLPARSRFAAVAVCGGLLPVSNLVPMSQRFADRYLLLVLAVLVVPIASLIDAAIARARRARRGGRAACAALAAIGLCLAAAEARASAQLVPSWHSSRTLWAHAVAAQPRAFLARLKYSETLQDARQWSEAIAQLRAAKQLRPHSLLPSARLFQLDAERAELNGILAAGTAARWLTAMDRATTDRAAYQALADEVDRTPCRTCSNALILVGLGAWPRPDAELLALARSALDHSAWQRARLYLGEVRDRALPELARLTAREAADRNARPVHPTPDPPAPPAPPDDDH